MCMSTSLALSKSSRRTFEIIQEEKEHEKEIQNKIASIHFGIRGAEGNSGIISRFCYHILYNKVVFL